MKAKVYDRNECRMILKISEGFPSQSSKAIVKFNKVSPSRSGHAISKHLAGAAKSETVSKQATTKFCSKDDMADALELVLNSETGKRVLEQLKVGGRAGRTMQVNRAFAIEVEAESLGRVRFNSHDLGKANVSKTECFVVLEGRARGDAETLHVQTFYPILDPLIIAKLWEIKTSK